MLTRLVKGVAVAGHTVLLGKEGGVQNFDRNSLFCSKRIFQDSHLAQSEIFCIFTQPFHKTMRQWATLKTFKIISSCVLSNLFQSLTGKLILRHSITYTILVYESLLNSIITQMNLSFS
jgi:hypothetical protein